MSMNFLSFLRKSCGKCNFGMTPYVRPLVGWMVGWSVGWLVLDIKKGICKHKLLLFLSSILLFFVRKRERENTHNDFILQCGGDKFK